MPRPFHDLAFAGLFLAVAIPAQVSKDESALVQTYLEQQAKAVSKNMDRFAQFVQPYAPLDFQARTADREHASALRNYFFGSATGIAGFEGTVAVKMANDFHCGQPCAESRIQLFIRQHERISGVVQRFVPLTRLNLVAQWGTINDFRVNDTFVQHGEFTTFRPAGLSGIVPNSSGKAALTLTAASGLSAADAATAEDIAAELASLRIAAIVRSPQGIRVVRSGNSDNEAGLLFKRLDAPEPKPGDDFGEGLDVVGVTKLAQDIYYFETS